MRFTRAAKTPTEVAARAWKRHVGEFIRVKTTVERVRISESSNTAFLTLEPDIAMVVFSAVKSAWEETNGPVDALPEKKVILTGMVVDNTARNYGIQIVLGRPWYAVAE